MLESHGHMHVLKVFLETSPESIVAWGHEDLLQNQKRKENENKNSWSHTRNIISLLTDFSLPQNVIFCLIKKKYEANRSPILEKSATVTGYVIEACSIRGGRKPCGLFFFLKQSLVWETNMSI